MVDLMVATMRVRRMDGCKSGESEEYIGSEANVLRPFSVAEHAVRYYFTRMLLVYSSWLSSGPGLWKQMCTLQRPMSMDGVLQYRNGW